MKSVLQNIFPKLVTSTKRKISPPIPNSNRVKAPVVGAGSTDFGGARSTMWPNRLMKIEWLAASQKTSDEVEGVNQASTDQVRLLWRLWGQISENDKL